MDKKIHSVDTRIDCSKDVPLVQQSMAEECDINVIVDRAKRGADISGYIKPQPRFGDFRNMPDLRSAMLVVKDAENRFMQLDAKIRERFANDPARLLDFVNDDRNRDEAVKLGLIEPPPVADPPLEHEAKPRAKKAEPKGDAD